MMTYGQPGIDALLAMYGGGQGGFGGYGGGYSPSGFSPMGYGMPMWGGGFDGRAMPGPWQQAMPPSLRPQQPMAQPYRPPTGGGDPMQPQGAPDGRPGGPFSGPQGNPDMQPGGPFNGPVTNQPDGRPTGPFAGFAGTPDAQPGQRQPVTGGGSPYTPSASSPMTLMPGAMPAIGSNTTPKPPQTSQSAPTALVNPGQAAAKPPGMMSNGGRAGGHEAFERILGMVEQSRRQPRSLQEIMASYGRG